MEDVVLHMNFPSMMLSGTLSSPVAHVREYIRRGISLIEGGENRILEKRTAGEALALWLSP